MPRLHWKCKEHNIKHRDSPLLPSAKSQSNQKSFSAKGEKMKDMDESSVCLKTESVKNPVKYQQDFPYPLPLCLQLWPVSTLGAYQSDV